MTSVDLDLILFARTNCSRCLLLGLVGKKNDDKLMALNRSVSLCLSDC